MDIPSRCCEYGVKIGDTIQHCDSKDKTSDKSNENGRHQCLWNSPSSILAFFCQMDGAIDARVNVIWIGEASQEDYPIGGPSRVVDKCPPYEFV